MRTAQFLQALTVARRQDGIDDNQPPEVLVGLLQYARKAKHCEQLKSGLKPIWIKRVVGGHPAWERAALENGPIAEPSEQEVTESHCSTVPHRSGDGRSASGRR